MASTKGTRNLSMFKRISCYSKHTDIVSVVYFDLNRLFKVYLLMLQRHATHYRGIAHVQTLVLSPL